MNERNTDVVIIGGGVIGTAIAWHLAERNVGVILLEKSDLAAGSSGACDGLVFLQSKKPGIHLSMALAGRERFEALEGRLPLDMEYRNRGGMVVIESEAEYRAMETHVRKQQAGGLSVSLLDRKAARELEPELSEEILGAAWSPMDGQINPIALTLGFGRGAEMMGAGILRDHPVTGLVMESGRVKGVRTPGGTFYADTVINAAGVYAPEIGRMAGIPIPITPRRGQLLVTRPLPRVLRCCLLSAGYIAAKYNPELVKEGARAVSMEQTDGGTLLLGSTREFAGFDTRTTLDGTRAVARNAGRVMPMLKRVRVIRSFAGLRPYTPDGLPILGEMPGVSGLITAAGHEGDGIALSAVTGELIAQLVVEGKTRIPLDPFSPARFQGEALNRGA